MYQLQWCRLQLADQKKCGILRETQFDGDTYTMILDRVRLGSHYLSHEPGILNCSVLVVML